MSRCDAAQHFGDFLTPHFGYRRESKVGRMIQHAAIIFDFAEYQSLDTQRRFAEAPTLYCEVSESPIVLQQL
ncbi:MAG: hypothetical protein ABSH22_19870 [Tepidisphaeraceae bacterium]